LTEPSSPTKTAPVPSNIIFLWALSYSCLSLLVIYCPKSDFICVKAGAGTPRGPVKLVLPAANCLRLRSESRASTTPLSCISGAACGAGGGLGEPPPKQPNGIKSKFKINVFIFTPLELCM